MSLEWMRRWGWIADAVAAVPGIRHSDLLWLSERYGYNLWKTQLTRALQTAVREGLVQGSGRAGYAPTLLGLAALDYYRFQQPSPITTSRGLPPRSFEIAGETVGSALSANYLAFAERLAHKAYRSLDENFPAFRYYRVDNIQYLVLRGIFHVKSLDQRWLQYPGNISRVIQNALIAKRPDGLWTEYWVADPEDGDTLIPIVTIDSSPSAEKISTLFDNDFPGPTGAIMIRPSNLVLSTGAENRLQAYCREMVTVPD